MVRSTSLTSWLGPEVEDQPDAGLEPGRAEVLVVGRASARPSPGRRRPRAGLRRGSPRAGRPGGRSRAAVTPVMARPRRSPRSWTGWRRARVGVRPGSVPSGVSPAAEVEGDHAADQDQQADRDDARPGAAMLRPGRVAVVLLVLVVHERREDAAAGAGAGPGALPGPVAARRRRLGAGRDRARAAGRLAVGRVGGEQRALGRRLERRWRRCRLGAGARSQVTSSLSSWKIGIPAWVAGSSVAGSRLPVSSRLRRLRVVAGAAGPRHRRRLPVGRAVRRGPAGRAAAAGRRSPAALRGCSSRASQASAAVADGAEEVAQRVADASRR